MLTITPPIHASIEPDAGQLGAFIRSMFRHATPSTIISLRAFRRTGKALFIRNFEVEVGLDAVIAGAIAGSRDAAKAGAVFSPPVATFKSARNAAEPNLAEGLTISVECDARASWARQTLTATLGRATVVVASGGSWTHPETLETEPKLHLHWRLAVPARDPEALRRLKFARGLATDLVGADRSSIPVNHPMRWPGSWHLKAEPRLCTIVESTDREIDLDVALEALREAAEAEDPGHRGPGQTFRELSGNQKAPNAARNSSPPADVEELREALRFCPNDFPREDCWNEWTVTGLRIFAAVGRNFQQALDLFDGWSQKSPLYDKARTRQRMIEIAACPPDRTGAGAIFKVAMANGWRTKPTHEAAGYIGIEDARREIARVIHNFLHPNAYQEAARELLSTAYAMKSETGVGKTEEAIRAIARYVAGRTMINGERFCHDIGDYIKAFRFKSRRVGYGVVTHKLGGEIKQRFRDHGVEASTYRGRTAIDPEGDGELMCLAPDKVDVAIEARQDIETSCCRRGKVVCQFYDLCGFQRQKEGIKNASVVIFASDSIFHAIPVIGNLDVLFLDESYWAKQISNEIEISLTALSADLDGELRQLAEVLMMQREDGALLLKYAACTGDVVALRVRLLNEMPKFEFSPDMSASAMKAFARRNARLIRRATLYRNLADVLPDIDTMWSKDIAASGRLSLDTEGDKRVLRWCGVRKITKQFDVPTFAMDATLPSLDILRLTHPSVKQVADIRVAMPPSVYILQVVGAPTSKAKLITGPHKEKHQQEIVRYIIRRWIETGRGPTLVIAQEQFEDEILRHQLPKEIALLHFNALSGVDAFKDVRLAIIIGRTQPRTDKLEALAGTLSGTMPECATADGNDVDGNTVEALRYRRVKRGIRLRDGTGRAVRVDEHPDELCEALRWQICEGELIQALGRPRGINRDDSTPLNIDLLFNEALPVEVEAVENWERPSLYHAVAAEGALLESPTDMQKVWPHVWKNLRAAERTSAEGMPDLPNSITIDYKLNAPKQKWRAGKFDLAIIADPAAWLRERLGPVTLRAVS